MSTTSSLPTSISAIQSASGDDTGTVNNDKHQLSSIFERTSFATQYKGIEYLMFIYASKMLEMMSLVSHSLSEPLHYLDQACGTGVCIRAVLNVLAQQAPRAGATTFTASDASPAMLDVLRTRINPSGPAIDPAVAWPRVISADGRDLAQDIKYEQGDMTNANHLSSNQYTHVTCNFGPAICSAPYKALSEMYRVTTPGGSAGASFWRILGWMGPFCRVINQIRVDAIESLGAGRAEVGDEVISQVPTLDNNPEEACRKMFAGVTRSDLTRHEDWTEEGFIAEQWKSIGFEEITCQQVAAVTTNDRTQLAGTIEICTGAMYSSGIIGSPEFVTKLKETNFAQRIIDGFDKDFEQAKHDCGEEVLKWSDWRAYCFVGKKPEDDS